MCHILLEEMCTIGTYTIGCDCAVGSIRSKWLQQYDEIWLIRTVQIMNQLHLRFKEERRQQLSIYHSTRSSVYTRAGIGVITGINGIEMGLGAQYLYMKSRRRKKEKRVEESMDKKANIHFATY